MNRYYLVCAVAWLLLATACSKKTTQSSNLQSVKITTVTPAEEQNALQYPGKVKAAQDINLAFRVSGTIQRILVEDGSPVREGQLLAELDPSDYQVQLNATEAEYHQIKAEAERIIALYNDQGTTPNNYDKAVYGLKQITAKYQHHKDQLAYTKLYAPFNGFVQKHLFNSHETVAAGMPVISMIGSGQPEVEINLPAADYIERAHFNRFQCTFDIYPGRVYLLKLISITPKANANQLYTMRLQLLADNQPMPSVGLNTMVSIFRDSTETHVLSVPTGALLHQEEQTYIYRYNDTDLCIHRCPVQLIRLLSDGRALILSDHVKPGDTVVASGVHSLSDGEQVKPLPAQTSTNVGGLL
ncbi:MAG: efflux RND transporter periplasmic adaptor subunit [Parabacteroides sp.]